MKTVILFACLLGLTLAFQVCFKSYTFAVIVACVIMIIMIIITVIRLKITSVWLAHYPARIPMRFVEQNYISACCFICSYDFICHYLSYQIGASPPFLPQMTFDQFLQLLMALSSRNVPAPAPTPVPTLAPITA